eukprot:3882469-Prymnesium_polylepis.1
MATQPRGEMHCGALVPAPGRWRSHRLHVNAVRHSREQGIHHAATPRAAASPMRRPRRPPRAGRASRLPQPP